MSRRTALIGMNNPLSTEPGHALWPDPPNCTGWRIWKMLEARTGASQRDYLRAFDRFNLGTRRKWSVEEARDRWRDLRPMLAETYDTIVLLGRAVESVTKFGLPLLYISREVVCIPHPSGLNHWYNTPLNRQIVETLLEELYVEALGG